MLRPATLTTLAAAILALVLTACFSTESSGAKPDPSGTADSVATGVAWNTTAVAFRNDTNLRVAYDCPASGTATIIWGTDTYTDDSSVCTAGVHAGKITLAQGGRVIIKMIPGQSAYTGSTRNGITSMSYGLWLFSFVFL